MNLGDFLEEEKNGVIFCKIGKSSDDMWGKGGHFPYRDYIGRKIELIDGRIIFERLDDVVKYLHYGDDLVIFSFTDGKNDLPLEGYIDNGGNKGCYDTKCIYVKDVLSFRDASTVDYIYMHSKDKTNFEEYSSLAVCHLKDRNLLESAQRWEELIDSEKVYDNELISEEVRTRNSFWNSIKMRFRKSK